MQQGASRGDQNGRCQNISNLRVFTPETAKTDRSEMVNMSSF